MIDCIYIYILIDWGDWLECGVLEVFSEGSSSSFHREYNYKCAIIYCCTVLTKFLVRCVFDSSRACSSTSITCDKLVGSVCRSTSCERLFCGTTGEHESSSGVAFSVLLLAAISSVSRNSFMVTVGTAWFRRLREATYMGRAKICRTEMDIFTE